MTQHTCKRCQYVWIGRTEKPKECPNCKSRYWSKDLETVKA